MELKTVIETVVVVALVVIVGFLVIAMVQGFVADGGIVYDFFQNIIAAVTDKASSLVSGFTG